MINVLKYLLLVIFVCIISTAIFNLERFTLVYCFSENLNGLSNDLLKLFDIGTKLDLHILIQITFGILLIGVIISLIEKKNLSLVTSFLCVFYSIIISLSCLLSFINFFYYRTYNNVIDTFFFNFFHEDLKALFMTIVLEYPIFKIFLVTTLTYILSYYSIKFFLKSNSINKFIINSNYYTKFILIIICLIFLYTSYYGGFTTTKIRAKSVQFTAISANQVINKARANPISLIHRNYKEYKEASAININNINIQTYKDTINNFNLKQNNDNLLDAFYSKTKNNPYLSEHKPNVVIVFSESLSSQMGSFHSKDFNVLSSLKNSMDSDYYFPNFIAEGEATAKSLLRLLFRSPFYMLPYHNKYVETKYQSFALTPYIEQGYEVYFITGSQCDWGNMQQILNNNGISNMICSRDIIKKFPKADNLFWGIADEYLYYYAEELLQNNTKPTAIFIMNTTNHPPYELPVTYKETNNIKYPENIFNFFKQAEDDEIISHYRTFRYATEKLGDFINNISNNETTKNNTIITYTGDHNARIGNYNLNEVTAVSAKGVIFGIHIPQNYIDHDNITYNKDIIASHKDIFPTLIEHSLSNQKYLKLGCDILSNEKCPYTFAFNEKYLILENPNTNNLNNNIAKQKHEDYSKLLQVVFSLQVNPNFK
ncbi:MAG: LTA synthase family protein [Succinivibrionaceae bacterium]